MLEQFKVTSYWLQDLVRVRAYSNAGVRGYAVKHSKPSIRDKLCDEPCGAGLVVNIQQLLFTVNPNCNFGELSTQPFFNPWVFLV